MFGFGKKADLFDSLYGKDAPRRPAGPPLALVESPPEQSTEIPQVELAALPQYQWQFKYDDGDKWQGGFGPTQFLFADYWTLRARSVQLFETNLYARGLIRRLITNELNTGLHLEVVPEESLLGLEEDALADWSELVENRFSIWADQPRLCDHVERSTFGALQIAARMEALIAGDVLVVLQQDQRTGLPRVRLFSGSVVQSPLQAPAGGNKIVHGVEIDPQGRHVAFWINQQTADSRAMEPKRLPAYGEKSGRRLAWLVYGTDKKLDDVRGKPLLSLVLQSLKEIDRYRDATQRKAVVLSMLAMFVSKTTDKPGTRPLAGGAIRRDTQAIQAGDGSVRSYKIAEQIPGVVIDELQTGEEPKAFSVNGTTETFGVFEEAIVQAVAWANEVPPEILTLSFNSNYSASQAAINEFKMYLNRVRTAWGDGFCQPIYVEWLISEVLSRKIDAPGLLEAWRDTSRYDEFGAWTAGDWAGQIKPAVDLSKLVRGYAEMVNEGFITRDRATRELTGTKFSKNVQRIERENAALADANRSISELANPSFPSAAPLSAEEQDAADASDAPKDSGTKAKTP